jgi:hypothetical protein
VLTHGASSKSSPAEAGVCIVETAVNRESTDHRSKWPKRRNFLENRESRAARPEPNLRMPTGPYGAAWVNVLGDQRKTDLTFENPPNLASHQHRLYALRYFPCRQIVTSHQSRIGTDA